MTVLLYIVGGCIIASGLYIIAAVAWIRWDSRQRRKNLGELGVVISLYPTTGRDVQATPKDAA